MASILAFVSKSEAAFDDEVTRIIGEAFDLACEELHDIGQPDVVYEVMAKRIIATAKLGERDLLRLRDAGLTGLGFKADGKRVM